QHEDRGDPAEPEVEPDPAEQPSERAGNAERDRPRQQHAGARGGDRDDEAGQEQPSQPEPALAPGQRAARGQRASIAGRRRSEVEGSALRRSPKRPAYAHLREDAELGGQMQDEGAETRVTE